MNHTNYFMIDNMDFAGVAGLLAYLSEKWCPSIHHFGESEAVTLDISKASEKLWHGALLPNLIVFGTDNDFSRFISSFLRDRSIRAVTDEVSSDESKLN